MIKFENHTNGRYYYIHVESDLFDDHVLSVLRGGNSCSRRIIRIMSGTMDQIAGKISDLAKRRLRRGYTLVND